VGVIREQVREAGSSFGSVFSNKGLRRISLALIGSVVGDWAYAIAVSIWAYEHGGVTALGIFGVARYVTLALCAPIASTLADRYPKKTVMVWCDLSRAFFVVIGAVVVATEGPEFAVYGLALVASALGTAFRPAQAALIPRLANDPAELTAANVTASTIESVGFFAGPAIGGLLLAVADVPVVYLFDAATFLWSAFVLAGVPSNPGVAEAPDGDTADAAATEPGEDAASDEEEELTFRAEVLAGFKAIGRNQNLRLISALYAAQTVVAGASVVYDVAIVLELLERGESTVGLVNAVLGIGGIIGGFVALVLARREKLAADFGWGVMMWAAPLLLVSVWPTLAATAIAMMLIGLANSVVDISADTIVQRVTEPAVMGRVFGALFSIQIGGMALGALLMPILIHAIGVRGGIAVIGVVISVIALTGMPALARIDKTVLAPEGLTLFRKVPMLAVLDRPTLERLARASVTRSVAAGQVVFSEGDPGDRYWVIERGRVSVTANGRELRELGPGEGFGEIALLRDVPRTATVTALDDTDLRGLERTDFIPAVSGSGESRDMAETTVNRLLAFSS